MATRTIVTSQPDVACDVCARRLLRGEQPDVFIGAGRRRIVCELCAPRAAHEGWMRERDSDSLALPPMRPRRGRSLFERLPGPFRARPANTVARQERPQPDGAGEDAAEPYDLFAEPAPAQQQPAGEAPAYQEEPGAPQGAERHAGVHEQAGGDGVVAQEPSVHVQEAIAVFNASEFPRRVAGVTRSLGPPAVTVRSAEHLSSVVSIVVAWELCWYRYEVDLSEPGAEAQVVGQGTELAELAREDRLANAAAGESGLLALAQQ